MQKNLLVHKLESLSHRIRLYMPGHKGRGRFAEWKQLDLTEISGADNLHHPRGVIREVEEKIAQLYGSDHCALLVGGSTAGLQAALLGNTCEGDKMLVASNCHRSVFSALALGGIEPILVHPDIDPVLGVGAAIDPRCVEAMCKAHPEIKALVMVSPTYFGNISQIGVLADILHRHNKLLIVDEAHGAHLHFCPGLPDSAVDAGADCVIQSTHKILGSLTQTGLIHCCGTRLDWQRTRRFLAMLQSSSPSNPLMVSIEAAVDEADEQGEAVFSRITEAWQAQKAKEKATDFIRLYNTEAFDYSKWLLMIGDDRGLEIAERLREDYHIECELAEKNFILAMTGIGTTASDLSALSKAIDDINRREKAGIHRRQQTEATGLSQWQYRPMMTLREALFLHKTQKWPLSQAAGKIAGNYIIPYPPGIPIVLPGEKITTEMISYLAERMAEGLEILGVDDGNVEIIADPLTKRE